MRTFRTTSALAHMGTRLLLPVALTMVALAGCARTPPTRLYLLVPARDAQAGAQIDLPTVVVGPVRVPRYLQQPQMVVRTGPEELTLAPFDHWAEDLEPMVARVTAANLGRLLGTDRVALFPWRSGAGAAIQVEIDLIRFDADADGRVIIEGFCSVRGPAADPAATVTSLRLQAQSQAEAQDPAAIAAAHSRALATFCEQLAGAVREQVKPEP